MKKIALRVFLFGFVSSPALAQEAKPAGPVPSVAEASAATASAAQSEAVPLKRVTFATGFDFATSYLFRGILQEDHGTIVPPYVDLGVVLYQGRGAIKSVSANVGNWNSLHSGPTGRSGQGNAWYEADYYASVTLAVGKWKPGALFTSYTSPNDVFNSVHELAAVLAYDDSSSAFPLSPKAIVAFELQGQADGGTSRGSYLELGIRPAIKLTSGKYPLSVAVPVKAGFSLKDYYEGAAGSSAFGYFDTGAIASVAVTSGKLTWDLHGGVDLLWLGDSMQRLNHGNRFKPVGVIGVGITY
jgi:hypothetical protein